VQPTGFRGARQKEVRLRLVVFVEKLAAPSVVKQRWPELRRGGELVGPENDIRSGDGRIGRRWGRRLGCGTAWISATEGSMEGGGAGRCSPRSIGGGGGQSSKLEQAPSRQIARDGRSKGRRQRRPNPTFSHSRERKIVGHEWGGPC
jgi:hypothetical protein